MRKYGRRELDIQGEGTREMKDSKYAGMRGWSGLVDVGI